MKGRERNRENEGREMEILKRERGSLVFSKRFVDIFIILMTDKVERGDTNDRLQPEPEKLNDIHPSNLSFLYVK